MPRTLCILCTLVWEQMNSDISYRTMYIMPH